jgi:hypothetical protein
MAAWLENLANAAHRNFYALALAFALTAGALVVVDLQTHWVASLNSLKLIRNLGKSIGEVAFNFGFIAILYYGVRESFVKAKKAHVTIPDQFDSMVKYWITVLRLVHPMIGVLVFSFVLLHGYIMWQVWAAGNISLAIGTGLSAGSVLIAIAASGLYLRWKPQMMKFRVAHRFAGILFVVAFIVHQIVAD